MRTHIRDNRQNVLELQTFLRAMALSGMGVRLINPDGIFGIETTEAVKDGQRALAIAVTGIVDYPTWDAFHTIFVELQTLEP